MLHYDTIMYTAIDASVGPLEDRGFVNRRGGLSGPDAAHAARFLPNPPPDNLNSSIFLMKPKVHAI